MPLLSLPVTWLLTLMALTAPGGAEPAEAVPTPEAASEETPPMASPPVSPARPVSPPTTAMAALVRAAAAYQYGDMATVVEAARLVVDGALPASEPERAEALRLLGVGLFLTHRPAGAEEAFVSLLKMRSRARLDPATTRPEVVAFFEEVRLRHAPAIEAEARRRSRRNLAWAFLPPLGQFKNGDSARGFIVLGLEAASLAGLVTTRLLLGSWCRADLTCGPGGQRTSAARTARTLNLVSAGALAATYVLGVTDALWRSSRERPEPASWLQLVVLPDAMTVALSSTF